MTDMENTETLLEPDSTATKDTLPKGSNKTWIVILVLVVILAAIITGIILLASAPEGTTTFVRDIFIILMALISIVIGAALVVLVIQIAALINLLQNEIKPILESTSETVNTLKGTTTFLSNNLTEPVIKFNSSVAGVRKLLSLLSMFKK
jgi:nitrate reductase gamma subunit